MVTQQQQQQKRFCFNYRKWSIALTSEPQFDIISPILRVFQFSRVNIINNIINIFLPTER